MPNGSEPAVATAAPETPDIESASEEYAKRFAGPVGEYFLDLQARITLDLISAWPDARVLDVGGGHAQIAAPLVRNGYSVTVTGSDDTCRERLDRALGPDGYEFCRCEPLDLPFADNAFDVVVAFRLLPHVNRWQGLLDELCRIARHGIIVDYPDRRSFNVVQSTFFGWKKAIEKNTRTFLCFSRGQLLGEFGRRGFPSATVRPEFFFPMVMHRAMGRVGVSKLLELTANGLGLTRLFGSPVILRVQPATTARGGR
jgi:SAM-dependent methyltransferase